VRKKCLWCGKKFEWDKTMYQFCDDCAFGLEITGMVVERITKSHINLMKELEQKFRAIGRR